MYTDLRPREVSSCPRHGRVFEGHTRCEILTPRVVAGELELVACGLPLSVIDEHSPVAAAPEVVDLRPKRAARFSAVTHWLAARRPRAEAHRVSTR
jgi:hypothetical protein